MAVTDDEAVRLLVERGKARGYLTYEEMNEELPDDADPDKLSSLLMTLDEMGIELLDEADVDAREKFSDGTEPAEEADAADDSKALASTLQDELETERGRIDDPVRMYLTQMGEIPLLTREQEVEISKRIEKAENRVYSLTLRFGVLPREMIIIARRVYNGKERFDRVVVERKGKRRERYLVALPKHIKEVEKLENKIKAKIQVIRGLRYKELRRKNLCPPLK